MNGLGTTSPEIDERGWRQEVVYFPASTRVDSEEQLHDAPAPECWRLANTQDRVRFIPVNQLRVASIVLVQRQVKIPG